MPLSSIKLSYLFLCVKLIYVTVANQLSLSAVHLRYQPLLDTPSIAISITFYNMPFLFNNSQGSLSSFDSKSKSKHKKALYTLTLNFTLYLQSLLKMAGYAFNEREVYRPTFLRFMNLSLIEAVQQLKGLKSKLCLDVAEEQNLLKRLNYQSNAALSDVESRMKYAVECFREKLITHLKHCMLSTEFNHSETEESCDSFISFFSSVVFTETEKFIRYQSSFQQPKHTQNDLVESSSQTKQITFVSINNQDNATFISGEATVEIKTPSISSNISSIQLVATTQKHFIYFDSSKNITIKVLKFENPLVKDVESLNNELKIGKTITHPVLRRSQERTIHEGKQALSLEWVPGHPISEVNKRFSITAFLAIAREIVSCLLAMHKKYIMHMNLTCDHIIINPDTNSVKIIGCASSTSFSCKNDYISSQEIYEKDLRYVSPEQTGRINHEIDFRSDFYSLGVIFYKLLTGQYPHENTNMLKLIHLHIVQDPIPVFIINQDIPFPISEMILKLMNKRAEERYQSAKGIIYDLDLIISEYESDKNLTSVVLGQHDIPEMILLPQKLYGRSTEYKKLLSVFDQVTSNSFELVFIAGNSGTGKSALVFELYKVAAQQDGFFASGKYDCSKSDPYSGLLEAVQNFCDDLVLKDETTLAKYRTQIQAAVGQEGRVLTDVINNLHSIIGQQPIISYAFGQEAKNRFNYVFIKFMRAICSDNFPIIFVIEDLHLLDPDSFDLLCALVQDKFIKNLMFVGTYREGEITDEHTFALLLQNIKNTKIRMTSIKLDNLDHESLNEFISNILRVSPYESYQLAAWFHNKTKGNPFFVNQMLKSLCEKDAIFFCIDKWKWKWDVSIFDENDITESTIEWLCQKVKVLDEHTQQTLQVASCLGSHFSLPTLELIVNNPEGIQGTFATGMITQYKGNQTLYRFVNDQIQSAVFSLLPQKKEIFLYIGKKLWDLFSKEQLKAEIFTVVNLLYYTLDIVTCQVERTKMAALFMEAGEKAMASTAFKKAFKFLDAGIELLGHDCWNLEYDLSLKLHDIAARAAYCVGNNDRMSTLKDEISVNATSDLHLVQSCSLQIKFYNEELMWEQGVCAAVKILNKIGEIIDLDQTASMVAYEVQRAKSLVSGKSHEEIATAMTEMRDECSLSIMMIYCDILSPSFVLNPELYIFIASRMVHLTFKYGFSKYSSVGISAFGSVLIRRGDKLGYQFGNLALHLLETAHVKEVLPHVYIIFYACISFYYSSVHLTLEPLLKTRTTSLEVGFTEGIIIGSSFYCYHAFLSGISLSELHNTIEEMKASQPINTKAFLSINQALLNLTDTETKDPALLNGNVFDCSICDEDDNNEATIARACVICCVVAYLFQDYSLALKFAVKCREQEHFLFCTYSHPMYIFYDGLVSLAIARHGEEKKKWISNAGKKISQLKAMAENAPMNYINKVHILEAELAAVCGDATALEKYKEAISSSQKYGFIHEEAIACERTGMFLLELNANDTQTAYQYLLQSYKCYERWGARTKMYQLRKKYPSFLEEATKTPMLHGLTGLVLENSQATVSVITDWIGPQHKKIRF